MRQDPGRPAAPFIVGAGRSGTTLLRLMLDSHPELAVPPETHFIGRLVEAFPGGQVTGVAFAAALGDERRWGDFGLDRDELAERLGGSNEVGLDEALRGFYAAYAEGHGKERWGDKTPGYCESMILIQGLLEEARFIHVIRDGRDVALATSKRNGKRAARNAATWQRKVSEARVQAEALDHYVEVRYEDLVNDAEQTLRRLCDYIALSWDPVMLDYHTRAAERLRELGDLPGRRIGGRPATAALRRSFYELTLEPPIPSEIGRWRTDLAPEEALAIEHDAGDLLVELGYEVRT
jgi:hypothetical protein